MAIGNDGVFMRLDLVMFRRGKVGVMVYILYIDGDEPVVPIVDIVRLMDERILEVDSP